MVNHTDSIIQQLEYVVSTMKDAETGQRGFLVAGKEIFLQPYTGSTEKALEAVDRVKALTADNPAQQQSCEELREDIMHKSAEMQELINAKRITNSVDLTQLEKGKEHMDAVRATVQKMEARERQLLEIRTASLNRSATFTPILILVAAALSILITIVFFSRLNNDFGKRVKLQKELEDKDAEISRRIDIIQNIANKIAEGDYQTRVNDSEKDSLGSLSGSLNKMAESLDYSFNLLSAKEWLQTGIASLNDKMIGEHDIKTLSNNIIAFVTDYTKSQVGALYILSENEDTLKLEGGYAIAQNERGIIKLGVGIVGQAATSGKEIILKDINPDNVLISYATGEIKPKSIVAVPVFHEDKVKGVIEVASLSDFTKTKIEFINSISHQVGIAIFTAQNRAKLQQLLEETQAQSEELQAQHSELEALNTELEAQAQNLQASEEELKVQQEEILQTNKELEERTRLLEERNQIIAERNQEIQKKAEELEISTKYKSEFLANMSHELRTPLNSILLLSRLLSENNESNLSLEQVESARVIQSSGNGLLSLIDEILDLSKIEAGKMDLDYTEIHTEEVLDDMRALFAPIARERGLELNIKADTEAPVAFETDKMRLEQILKNLLSNALKFTSAGSVTLEVCPVKENHALLTFVVTDTGIGIAKEKLALVFEAFQQADGSTRRKYGGTGLGLSISRELTKLLGGDIRVKSEPGEGSKFIVTIPILRTYKSSVYTGAKYILDAEDESVDTTTAENKGRTKYISPLIPLDIADDRDSYREGDKVILIIEDDTNFATSLLTFTRKRGYKGIVAVRGDQGVEMAKHYKPLAILLDIQLPVKDGWEVMEELKTTPATRHIPVHIMSSMEVKKESLMSGAVDFINKPVALEQMQQIFQKLEEALSRYPKKVLIVEENTKHAKALAYFLETFNVNAEIKGSIKEGVDALKKEDVDCVILDMGIPDKNAYETLETVKQNPGLEHLPIIIFTGKNLSKAEETRIKQYADSIVVKTAHSYQRILDEVSLFLHLVEGNKDAEKETNNYQKLGEMSEVLKNKTVLIADDDVRNIFSLTKALEQHQMKVLSATDGKEALELLNKNPNVDIVLMDMMMPEMDGYESISMIRKIQKFKNLPVLAVTAKAMMGDREKCIRAGASDYISKPVDIDQLLSLLRVWLYDKVA